MKKMKKTDVIDNAAAQGYRRITWSEEMDGEGEMDRLHSLPRRLLGMVSRARQMLVPGDG